jgi:hypothetical protein
MQEILALCKRQMELAGVHEMSFFTLTIAVSSMHTCLHAIYSPHIQHIS